MDTEGRLDIPDPSTRANNREPQEEGEQSGGLGVSRLRRRVVVDTASKNQGMHQQERKKHQLGSKKNVVIVFLGFTTQKKNAAHGSQRKADALRDPQLIDHV